ncbi:DUF4097 family beta strand repeat-containing protein [Microbacterium sp. NPDC077391]|uniref:DUF4097 family beta strand repeat protein n=1 Tax=Microbacterium commune TaxID=2762219 RepID=A0ABR8W425_9MICO|nr:MULTISPECIES: DUF4097 family beta strand repeat-containing protein [Microbacterium]MBD8011774.1 DUF4097 family beta strand repeat protein [Microbacterium commune]
MSGTKKSIGAITVVIAAVGGVVLLGSAASAAVTGLQQMGPQSGQLTADVGGVSSMDVEVGGADMRIVFDDVDDAELRVEGASTGGWTLRADDGRLEVRGPDRGFGWWSPDWLRGDERVTLVLPLDLKGVDAELTLHAGQLDVTGEFADLAVDVNAGSLAMTGDARTIDIELNAGRADVELRGVEQAQYRISAGRVVSALTTVPDSVDFSVSAGALDLTLPDQEYDLRREVSAGSLDSSLDQSSDSRHRITGSVSAGSATLRPGGTGE